ncbi:matrix metalloproteinase-2-like [Homalodisca vitripennis]|uniref:matrix metalloproteinase-2-like n=1 Tax=Homalodisca vitripennis TaxID=197043 RepID=UPI001EEBD3EC|nr:matrix metalloproteinase-2-like [Homalodisca vitripennis]
MSASDLNVWARRLNIPNFRGVFMREALPVKPHRIECGIINLGDLDSDGTHWTCYMKMGHSKVYFDSYGDSQPPRETSPLLGSRESDTGEILNVAIETFQAKYNLTVDGSMNPETEAFMKRPRCGNKDNPLPYRILSNTTKWFNNIVTWNWLGKPQYMPLVNAAFGVWTRHTNLTFYRSFYDPNIPISLDSLHVMYATRSPCLYKFDGRGSVLAHAFFPDILKNQTDIHFDVDEDWDMTMNLPAPGKTSFFSVLVHEIGHALGLSHSSQRGAVMNPYYEIPPTTKNMFELDLAKDDIYGIQYL